MRRAILKQQNQSYQFQNIPSHIKAVFTDRSLNLGFVNQSDAQMEMNRRKALSRLDIDLGQLVCAKQVHGDNVCVVGQKDKGRGALRFEDAIDDTDAFITGEDNIAISICVADCLPVFLIDKTKDIIGIAHCGWKSTQKLLLKRTISTMQSQFDSHPKDIFLLFGPAMRKCCFEVGKEFLGYFKAGIAKKQDKLFFDIIEVNQSQARESGVLEDNIFDSGICTYCQNDKFFSFRKEGDSCGRQMALIIKGGQNG